MKTTYYYLFFVSLVVILGCRNMSASDAEDLIQAEIASNQLNLSASRKLLQKVVDDPASSLESRIQALQDLALQDWRFFKNLEKARTRLTQAD